MASNCPPVHTVTTDFGDFPLRMPVEQGDGVTADCAPRRIVLDKILVDAAVAAGATAVIQPGGSIRDDEVIAAADAANIAMVFTGVRHFRH